MHHKRTTNLEQGDHKAPQSGLEQDHKTNHKIWNKGHQGATSLDHKLPTKPPQKSQRNNATLPQKTQKATTKTTRPPKDNER